MDNDMWGGVILRGIGDGGDDISRLDGDYAIFSDREGQRAELHVLCRHIGHELCAGKLDCGGLLGKVESHAVVGLVGAVARIVGLGGRGGGTVEQERLARTHDAVFAVEDKREYKHRLVAVVLAKHDLGVIKTVVPLDVDVGKARCDAQAGVAAGCTCRDDRVHVSGLAGSERYVLECEYALGLAVEHQTRE